MSKTAKAIITVCILLWFVFSFGIIGSLDIERMKIEYAKRWFIDYTVVLACIVGITALIEAWKEDKP